MTKAKKYIDTTERRNKALQYRKQGGTYRAVADAMIKEFGAEKLPKGYDERYVYNDVMAILKKINAEIAENAEEVLQLELQRLDSMFIKVFERAVKKGDDKAVLSCIRIMDRRDKYLGLGKPTKIAPTDPSGEKPYQQTRVSDDEFARTMETLFDAVGKGLSLPSDDENGDLDASIGQAMAGTSNESG